MRDRGFRIGLAAVVALVLLRLSVGWHFFYQGICKAREPSFSSAAFLRQAKGPLAEKFYELIPDYEGRERLSDKTMAARWKAYVERWTEYYAANQQQQAAADARLKGRIRQLKEFLAENDGAIEKYLNDLDRLHEELKEKPVGDTAFQRQRMWELRKRLTAQAAPWLAEVDRLSKSLEDDLWQLLDDDQQARGRLPINASSLDRINATVLWSNLIIGGCLIVGLFTRLAAAGGAAFMLSIVISQPELPWIYPPAPLSSGHAFLVNKDFIEMIALVTLATVPVGRWGGLDFFIHYLFRRKRSGGREAQ